MNVQADTFGGGGVGNYFMVCDATPYSSEPAVIGHEMGHGFGLDHSRIDYSTEDYKDLWDTMSTASAYMAVHPTYGHIGPGLNAANMNGRGWLDRSRVWVGDGVVELVPLHRRDIPGGCLAAQLGPFFVEFRVRDRWDAGIPQPIILVHRFEDNRSYLLQSSLVRAGDFLEQGGSTPLSWFTRITVERIDAAGQRATVRLLRRAPVGHPTHATHLADAQPPRWEVPPVLLGASGREALRYLSALDAVEALPDVGTRDAVREPILSALVDSIASRRTAASNCANPPLSPPTPARLGSAADRSSPPHEFDEIEPEKTPHEAAAQEIGS
jgi:hypothetical protein